MTLEHIETTIKKKAKELAGTFIQCKFCEGEAVITLQDFRYMVYCIREGRDYYLKEHNICQVEEIGVEKITPFGE